MYIFQYFLGALAEVLNIVLTIYMWIIIARAVLSWVNPDPRNFIVQFLYRVTEPVLFALRRRLPLSFGGFDFSPILVLIGIVFLKSFLVNSLYHASRSLG